MRITKFVTMAALVLAAGCSRAPVITIKNQSSLTISNIVLSGSGFANRIDERIRSERIVRCGKRN